jgi:ribonuclease HI
MELSKEGLFKLNVDASSYIDQGIGIGGIFSDDIGNLIVAFFDTTKTKEIEIAEAKALTIVLLICNTLNLPLDHYEAETDSYYLIQALKDNWKPANFTDEL